MPRSAEVGHHAVRMGRRPGVGDTVRRRPGQAITRSSARSISTVSMPMTCAPRCGPTASSIPTATASSAATSCGSACSRRSIPPTSPRSPAASTTSSPPWQPEPARSGRLNAMQVDDVLSTFTDGLAPLNRPIMVVALTGWFDASSAATGALEWLLRDRVAPVVAAIDPDPFYDFTQERPDVWLDEDETVHVRWPTNEFRIARFPDGSHDLVVLSGVEPHVRWSTYCECVTTMGARHGLRRGRHHRRQRRCRAAHAHPARRRLVDQRRAGAPARSQPAPVSGHHRGDRSAARAPREAEGARDLATRRRAALPRQRPAPEVVGGAAAPSRTRARRADRQLRHRRRDRSLAVAARRSRRRRQRKRPPMCACSSASSISAPRR